MTAGGVLPLTGVPRLRAAVIEAIDHPDKVLTNPRRPDETEVDFTVRAVIAVVAAAIATERLELR